MNQTTYYYENIQVSKIYSIVKSMHSLSMLHIRSMKEVWEYKLIYMYILSSNIYQFAIHIFFTSIFVYNFSFLHSLSEIYFI